MADRRADESPPSGLCFPPHAFSATLAHSSFRRMWSATGNAQIENLYSLRRFALTAGGARRPPKGFPLGIPSVCSPRHPRPWARVSSMRFLLAETRCTAVGAVCPPHFDRYGQMALGVICSAQPTTQKLIICSRCAYRPHGSLATRFPRKVVGYP